MSPPPIKPDFPYDNALVLNERDVERLLTEETPDVRIDVLRKVARHHSKKSYQPHEYAIAEQIFRVLVKDTEVTVRETLADLLKDNPDIPQDIIVALSNDVDSVALPVIESSIVLTDADLTALIKSSRHPARPVAIARRRTISEKVSLALVETHNPQTVSQLVKNTGAAISDDAYQMILRDHSKNNDVITIVAQRPNLPVTLVERIIHLVSDSLAEYLRSEYRLKPAVIIAETDKTREIATLKLVDGESGAGEVEKLVDQLQIFGRLTPSIILTSLCRGNLAFFEISLARLSSIPPRNAQLLIHDKGGLGFKALYSKAGLPEKFLEPCKLLFHVISDMQRAGQNIIANQVAQTLLARTAGRNVENLSYIVALIRQNAS